METFTTIPEPFSTTLSSKIHKGEFDSSKEIINKKTILSGKDNENKKKGPVKNIKSKNKNRLSFNV